VLLGLLAPDRGEVLLTPDGGPVMHLAEVDPTGWWAQIAWVPQRPVIEPGTVRDAVERGTHATDERLAATAALTGLDAVVAALPDGWLTRVGQGGAGLSLGQRQRLALTRALLAPAPLVVLDEPTAHLDADGERVVLDALRRLREQGRTVLLVAHRQSLLAVADRTVTVTSATLVAS
jgi:ABC-type transport system involved in cytochrome bd biosynthesis fused ATPase/permease subunit